MVAALPIAALVASGVGAAASAYGAIQQSQAAQASANYQSEVAKNNAIIANRNAAYSAQAGQTKAMNASLRSRSAIGEAVASMAANGVDVNSGSNKQGLQSIRETGALDTQTTEQNAMLEAYGYRSQATGFTAQQQLDAATAQQAPIAGAFGAAGDLLSGASSIGNDVVRYKQAGVAGF